MKLSDSKKGDSCKILNIACFDGTVKRLAGSGVAKGLCVTVAKNDGAVILQTSSGLVAVGKKLANSIEVEVICE